MFKKPFTNLLPQAFFEQMKADPEGILLDVRTPMEFNAFHLENAINIDIKNRDFTEEIEELDPDKSYYVYCRVGARSANACAYMSRLGFDKLVNLIGGIRALK
ncbi:MAG: rhodanese-like domain-containing protein [Chitinophagales bacterium]